MDVSAALGASPHAPLLLEGNGACAVAHHPPAPALAQLSSPHVLPCVGFVDVGGQARGLYPYHPGADLEVLAERHPDGLPAPWAEAIAADLLAAVDALAPHGLAPVVREEDLRVGADGVAVVVRVRESSPDDARRALADLIERLTEESEAERVSAAVLDGTVGPGERRAVADVPRRVPTALQVDAAKASAPPPKLVVARIGVLILALGLSMGWMMAPRASSTPRIDVPGAVGMSLQCTDASCEVHATFADGDASGRVDVATAQHYVCQRTARTLECTVSSP
ncbi:MAG: hypothetical protein EP330_07505 [Deltaproteobacteria bacterium]|nr:MAG: hypothetical protein EP330_07505 [Deltaproteobacteria bacterium]